MADDAAPADKPVHHEIATSADGRDLTVPFFGPLREPLDSILVSQGRRWEVYRELRRDGQVHATFQQRRLALVGRPLVVTPGADDALSIAAADQLRANLEAIAWDRITRQMHWGTFYGYSVGECMWEVRDGKVWLGGVKVRTPWRFRFTPEGELRLLTRADQFRGEVLPPKKFWTFATGADNDDEPYGLGLAHQLYWPVYFKRQGLAFWLRALEKFGAPTVHGTYPAGSSPEDQAKLLAAALALRIDGAVTTPEGTSLSLLESSRGTVDQATFARFINSEISKIVVGQTMTTDDGSSLAQGEVHERVLEAITDADDQDLAETFEAGPVAWMTAWNFPGAAIPQVRRPSPEDEDHAAELATKRAGLVKAMKEAGFEPTEESVERLLPGFRPIAPAEPPSAKDNVVPIRAAPAFAEGDQADAIDDYVEELDADQALQPILDRVAAVVAKEPTLAAAAEELGALLAEPVSPAFVELLSRSMLEARLAGEGGLELEREA